MRSTSLLRAPALALAVSLGCGGRVSLDSAAVPVDPADAADAAAAPSDATFPPADAPWEAPPDVAEVPIDAAEGCAYGGKLAQPFDTLQGPDGCTCMCLPGGVLTCSGLTCESPGLAACDYYGVSHPLDDHWTCSDGCNDCFCDLPGAWATTTMACAPTGVFCDVGGKTVPQGMHALADDGCNLCTCWGDGSVSCTTTWFCVGQAAGGWNPHAPVVYPADRPTISRRSARTNASTGQYSCGRG